MSNIYRFARLFIIFCFFSGTQVKKISEYVIADRLFAKKRLGSVMLLRFCRLLKDAQADRFLRQMPTIVFTCFT